MNAPETRKSLPQRLIKWLWDLLFPPRPSPPSPSRPRQQPQPEQAEGGRYDVQDQHQQSLGQTDSLGEALQRWKAETGQLGSIIDTRTGEDITPEPDDNGRYAVLDENGQQIGTFAREATAQQVWEEETDKRGSIIDTHTREDVTPFAGYLTDEELEEAMAMVRRAGQGWTHRYVPGGMETVDPERIAELIPLINQLRLPIFDLANAAGSSADVPTKSVTITKRESVVELKPRQEWRNVPVTPAATEWLPSPTAADDEETRRMRNYDEVTRVKPSDLVRPDFPYRLAQQELSIKEFRVEEEGEAPTKRMRFTVMEEEITTREWEETVEVTDQSRTQLLYLMVDISGSMFWPNPLRAEMAIALCVALVTKHLRDDSQYFFSWFANLVDHTQVGNSQRSKEQLIKFMLKAEPARRDGIGGGTQIFDAIQHAAHQVQRAQRSGDIPEILLVTDGDDNITAEEVFHAIGSDVVLHTVVVGNSNYSLRQHSTTYEELSADRLGYDSLEASQPPHYPW